MLDKQSNKLLDHLARICADGSYKIIEIGDLTKEMLPRFRIDAKELSQMIGYLSDNQMIDVKYSDEKVYCVAVLPKGRVAVEDTRLEKTVGGKRAVKASIRKRQIALLIGSCFLAGFLGAFLGSFLAWLVT